MEPLWSAPQSGGGRWHDCLVNDEPATFASVMPSRYRYNLRVPGLPVQERVDGLSDAGGIHDVGKVVLARHRVLGHVAQSLPEVP
jgi:hypothetical protein